MKESIRDVVTGDLSLEYFANRLAEGWKIVHIEWARDTNSAELSTRSAQVSTEPAVLPYGLQVGDGGQVEENPTETAVLLLMLEEIVREKRVQEIAAELNLRGFATRAATKWQAVDVFNLLPRLIEAGPSLLRSSAWQHRRTALPTPATRPN
jgi:hypothetical protein